MKRFLFLLTMLLVLLGTVSGCGNAVADSGRFPAGGYTLIKKDEAQQEKILIRRKRLKKQAEQYEIAEAGETNLEPEIIPANFLEEAYEVDGFASYDEILAKLSPGNGYAYLKLMGSDEVLMAVAEHLYETDEEFIVATSCSIYSKKNDKAECIGNITGPDEIYPIRVKDGIIYDAGDDHVESFFLTEDGYGLMTKDTISRSRNDDGVYDYMGILREDNTFGSEVTMIEGDALESFNELFDEYLSAQILNFTVVGGVVIEHRSDDREAIEDEMAADGYYIEEDQFYEESEETEGEYSEEESSEDMNSEMENADSENADSENPDSVVADEENYQDNE